MLTKGKNYGISELEQEVNKFSEDGMEIVEEIDITEAYGANSEKVMRLLQQLSVSISRFNRQTAKEIDKLENDSSFDSFRTYRFQNPFVGAVVFWKSEKKYFLSACCRGAKKDDHHAEFTLLRTFGEKGTKPEKATLFTTLEPCTKESRKEWSEACGEMIARKGIQKVYVGVLDPNPIIMGKGIQYLLDHGIDVRFFEPEYRCQIQENNHVFLEQFKVGNPQKFRDVFDTFINYMDFQAMEHYIAFDRKIIETKKEFAKSYGKLDIGVKYSNLFYFFKNMALNRSIFCADRELEKYTCSDDFALFFFDEPKRIVDGATLRLVITSKKEGMTKQDSERLLDCSLFSMVERLEEKLKEKYQRFLENKPDQEKLTDLQKMERKMFPDVVVQDSSIIREILINALVHRDYQSAIFTTVELNDDSIIIRNPVKKTIDDKSVAEMNGFSFRSNPTNPRLMRFFMDVGYCERKTFGMQLAGKFKDYLCYDLNAQVLETRLYFKKRS